MADVTLTYKGQNILELSASGNKTIKTAGKYCEDDIGLAYVKSGGGDDINILKGNTAPSNSRGENGSIYLQYTDDTRVPAEYQRLEYLESNGNQSIDTGLDITSTSYYEVKGSFTENRDNNSMYGLGYANKESDVLVYRSVIYNQVGASNIGIAYNSDVHIFRGNSSGLSTDAIIGNANWGNVPSSVRIRLFRITYNNIWQYTSSYCRIYYCKMYDSYALVRYFVPVKRLADSVLGMYDLVHDVFYTNDQTGDFIAGPVYAATEEAVFNTFLKVANAWQNLIGAFVDDVNCGQFPIDYPPLPSEYQELEYLRTTAESGYARINTVGYGVQAGDHIRLTFRGDGVICGQRNNGWNFNVNTVNRFWTVLYNDYKVFYSWEVLEQTPGDWCTCELGFNSTYSTDMTYGGWGSSTSSRDYNFFGDLGIFLVLRPVIVGNDPKELRSDFTCVRALIPCYRKSDGVNGFYDTVAGVFHTAFMGTFTRGPEIT